MLRLHDHTRVRPGSRRLSKAKLLSKDMEAEKKNRGKYFEARESAAKAAAQYRSLEPGRWDGSRGGRRRDAECIGGDPATGLDTAVRADGVAR